MRADNGNFGTSSKKLIPGARKKLAYDLIRSSSYISCFSFTLLHKVFGTAPFFLFKNISRLTTLIRFQMSVGHCISALPYEVFLCFLFSLFDWSSHTSTWQKSLFSLENSRKHNSSFLSSISCMGNVKYGESHTLRDSVIWFTYVISTVKNTCNVQAWSIHLKYSQCNNGNRNLFSHLLHVKKWVEKYWT